MYGSDSFKDRKQDMIITAFPEGQLSRQGSEFPDCFIDFSFAFFIWWFANNLLVCNSTLYSILKEFSEQMDEEHSNAQINTDNLELESSSNVMKLNKVN